MADVSSPAFWQNLYEHGGDGWETGAPAPPLVSLVETTPPTPAKVRSDGHGAQNDEPGMNQLGV